MDLIIRKGEAGALSDANPLLNRVHELEGDCQPTGLGWSADAGGKQAVNCRRDWRREGACLARVYVVLRREAG